MDEFIKNNPQMAGIDPIKLEFIKRFSDKEKPKSMSDAMPFLLANMNLAKKENINFTSPEIHLIAEVLCRNLPQEERIKVNKILSMLLH